MDITIVNPVGLESESRSEMIKDSCRVLHSLESQTCCQIMTGTGKSHSVAPHAPVRENGGESKPRQSKVKCQVKSRVHQVTRRTVGAAARTTHRSRNDHCQSPKVQSLIPRTVLDGCGVKESHCLSSPKSTNCNRWLQSPVESKVSNC